MRRAFQLRPYQYDIVRFIITHPRCMVWAGMGMGKTISTLVALRYLLDFKDAAPILVIAPLRVARSTWPDEIRESVDLIHIKHSLICGPVEEREAALAADADVYITNFEQIPWLVKRYGRGWPFKTIVVDEATRLKSFRLHQGSRRARELGRVAHLFCDRFIELTGTPATNGLLDLWGQAWFIDHGERLGRSMRQYEMTYFRPQRVGAEAFAVKWIPMPDSDARIKKRLSDVAITVNAEDWFPIEKPIESTISVDLPPPLAAKYKTLADDFFVQLAAGEIEAANAAVKLGKLLQFASGAVYADDGKSWLPVHDQKIEALKSVIEEAGGEPVLVAYQYRHELERILATFPAARELDKDPETIARWNRGEIPILVAHPAACGHGLNLQNGGRILVFFSLGFNYEHYAQMIERIGPTRQTQAGHPRSVFIYYLVTRGTVDGSVLQALRKKEKVLDFILGRVKHEKGNP